MSVLATSTGLVNWSAIGKIVLAAVIGGIGVVFAFGLLLLCLSRARSAASSMRRYVFYTLGGICGALCLAVVGIGVYAMVTKPVSKPAKPKSATVVVGVSNAPPRLASARP
jgi:hypothetical protein